MKKRKNLVKLDVIVRRRRLDDPSDLKVITYKPSKDFATKIFELAKKLWNRYKIVVSVSVVKLNGKTYFAITQDRSISCVNKNVPKITLYIDCNDGMIYIPEEYFDEFDPFFVYACAYYLIRGLGYETIETTIDKAKRLYPLIYRKIYISQSSI